jgi:hypothetical protein
MSASDVSSSSRSRTSPSEPATVDPVVLTRIRMLAGPRKSTYKPHTIRKAFETTGIWPLDPNATVVMKRALERERRDAERAALADATDSDAEEVTEASIRAGVEHTPRTRRIELASLATADNLTPRRKQAVTDGLLELAERQEASLVLRDSQLRNARASNKRKRATDDAGTMPRGKSRVFTGAQIEAEEERVAGVKSAEAAKKAERTRKKADREVKKAQSTSSRPSRGKRTRVTAPTPNEDEDDAALMVRLDNVEPTPEPIDDEEASNEDDRLPARDPA